MNKFKRILISFVAGLGLVAPMMAPVMVSAQTDTPTPQEQADNALKCGSELKFADDCTPAEESEASGRIDNIVKNVINIITLIVGVVAVIMIIIGGLRYVTSNGDSGQVGNAKNTIMYAVIGLVVVALAQVLVRFVVGRATQSDATE